MADNPQTPIPDDLMTPATEWAELHHLHMIEGKEHFISIIEQIQKDALKAEQKNKNEPNIPDDLMKSAEDWAEYYLTLLPSECGFTIKSVAPLKAIIRAIQQDALKAERARPDRLREVVKSLMPFEIVNGDSGRRTNPSNNINLNSNHSWLVSAPERSQHKLRMKLDRLGQALAETEPKEAL